MRHIISALVMNQPGVLAHISGMMASRAFNIDSLAVGPTENELYSRMTFVVKGSPQALNQVRKQLEKIVTIVKVVDYAEEEFVETRSDADQSDHRIFAAAQRDQRTGRYLPR